MAPNASKKPAAAPKSIIKNSKQTMKKPAAAGGISPKQLAAHNKANSGGEKTLDEKIAAFQKKPYDITDFLAKLSTAEREAVWKRFEYGRQEDPESAQTYKQVATGPGSSGTKQKLLEVFLKNKCSVKGQAYLNCLLEHSTCSKTSQKESWRPYKHMADYYGVPELLRRVRSGSVLARQDPAGEWEFKLVEKFDEVTEEAKRGFQSYMTGKMDEGMFKKIGNASGFKGSADAPRDALAFLQGEVPKGQLGPETKRQLSDIHPLGSEAEDLEEEQEEPPLAQEAERLSDLGSIGKKTSQRINECKKLMQRAIGQAKGTAKAALQKELSKLQSIKSGTTSMEKIKTILVEAMQAVKKASKFK